MRYALTILSIFTGELFLMILRPCYSRAGKNDICKISDSRGSERVGGFLWII